MIKHLFICIFILVSVYPYAIAQANGETSTYCDLSLRLALSKQKLADEHFLESRDTSVIRKNYKEAIDLTNKLLFYSDCENKEMLNLVFSYSNYRLMLFEQGYDFWGIKYSLKTLNPIKEYELFEEVKADFDEVYLEIEDRLSKIGKAEDIISKNETLADVQLIKSRIESYSQSKTEIYITKYEEQINEMEQRLDVIDRRQMAIESQSRSLDKQLESVEADLQSMVLSGISQAAGIPVDLSKIDIDAPLEQQVLQVGQVLLEDEAVLNSISEVSSSMDEVVKIYGEIKEIQEKGEEIIDIAKQTEALINEPTFERLMDLGLKVYEKLPEGDQTKIQAIIEEQPMVRMLFVLAKKNGDVESAFQEYLSEQVLQDNQIIELIAEKTGLTIPNWADDLLQKLVNGEAPEAIKNELIQKLIRSQTLFVYQQIPAEIQNELRNISGKNTDEAVIEWMKQVDLNALAEIELKNGVLVFPGINKQVDLKPYFSEIENHPIVKDVEQAKMVVEELIELGKELEYDLGQIVLEDLSIQDLEALVNKYFEKVPAAERASENTIMTQKLISQLPENVSQDVKKQLTAATLGMDMTNRNIRQKTNTPVTYTPPNPATSSEQTLSEQDQMLNAVFNAGLAYACPYAALALNMMNKYNQMNALVDKVNQLTRESKRLTVEKLHLYDMLESTLVSKKIAEYDKQIYEARFAITQTISAFYMDASEKEAKRISKYRLGIQLRTSLLFYLAERLRQQYYLVDKAIQFRHNTTIEEKIKSDPNNVRLALDQDIHLFNWLDRNIERQRYNLEELKVHWDKLARLMADNCLECRKGFAPAVNVIETQSISLKTLIPSEWAAFTAAQKGSAQEFTFHIPILPGLVGNKVQQNVIDLRILRARIGGIGATGKSERLYNYDLFHPGVAFIPRKTGFQKEILFPQGAPGNLSDNSEGVSFPSNPDDWPLHFKTEKLETWWKDRGGMGNGPFEGYGLYTIWKLTVRLTPKNRALTDIRLRWACSINSGQQDSDLDSKYYLSFLSGSTGKPLEINGDFFKSFGNIDGASDRIEKLLEKYDQDKTITIETDNIDFLIETNNE